MSAMERTAWFELIVSVVALATVTALYPWLGNGAVGAFGILGLLGGAYWFLRRSGPGVTVDERDRAIDLKARFAGVTAGWQVLLLTLIGIVLVSDYRGAKQVPLSLIVWLVFLQGAICYGVKGLVGVLSYRRQSRAAQG
ncbi:MAG: hypothetical protein AB7G28_19070 [Pirellulales bacterium]